MFRLQIILRPPATEQARGIGNQYLFAFSSRLFLPQHKYAGSEAGAIKQVWCQANDGLNQVHLQQLLADSAFCSFAEKRPLRQNHGHPTFDLCHRLDHVLHPGKVARTGGRQAGKIATKWIV